LRETATHIGGREAPAGISADIKTIFDRRDPRRRPGGSLCDIALAPRLHLAQKRHLSLCTAIMIEFASSSALRLNASSILPRTFCDMTLGFT
jgi:hypothetical protein